MLNPVSGVLSVGVGGVPIVGVIPKSGSNIAGYGPQSSLLKSSTPYVTSLYDGTDVSRFDMTRFWFGCEVAVGTGKVDYPTSCTVTVTGYRLGKAVAQQPFHYTPNFSGGLTAAPMQEAKLNSQFTKLDKVAFATTPGDPKLVLVTATAIDNVE
jgi:hypothetical protein